MHRLVSRHTREQRPTWTLPPHSLQGAIARALWSAYKLDLLRSGAVKLVHDCVLLVNPLILLALLHHVQHR